MAGQEPFDSGGHVNEVGGQGFIEGIVGHQFGIRREAHQAFTVERRIDQSGHGGAVIEPELTIDAVGLADIQALTCREGEVQNADHDVFTRARRLRQRRRPADGRHPVIDTVEAGEAHQPVIEVQEEGRAARSVQFRQRAGVIQIDAIARQQGRQDCIVERLAGFVIDRRTKDTVCALEHLAQLVGDRLIPRDGIIRERVDIAPGRADIPPERTDITPEGPDIAPERVDVAIEGVDVTAERTDIAPEGINVAVERIDVAPEGIDVAPEGRDVAPERRDVPVKGIDITPERIDIAPERVDVTAEGIDISPVREQESVRVVVRRRFLGCKGHWRNQGSQHCGGCGVAK